MTLHFIHIGKTGGTAMKQALRRAGVAYWSHKDDFPPRSTPFGEIELHHHGFRFAEVAPTDHVFFSLRDPVTRFISGFYSRLTKGQPRYYYEWTDDERVAFAAFPTPQRLARGLASEDDDERAQAEWAMRHIRHLRRMTTRIGRPPELESRLAQVVYIARQETLAEDFERLRDLLELPPGTRLPKGRVQAHRRDPSFSAELDGVELDALRAWYRADYELLRFCDEVRAQRGWAPDPAARGGLPSPG